MLLPVVLLHEQLCDLWAIQICKEGLQAAQKVLRCANVLYSVAVVCAASLTDKLSLHHAGLFSAGKTCMHF